MVLIGLAAGIALALAPRPALEALPLESKPVASAERADPWAESRHSRAILESQEAAPAAAAAFAEARPAGPAEQLSSPAVRVIDGDTFELGGRRIRIADIDTPEVRGRCAHETALAARATARMRTLLDAGPFELHRTGTRDVDAYGRQLRIVTRGGRSLGDQLVAEGLARTWSGRREPWC